MIHTRIGSGNVASRSPSYLQIVLRGFCNVFLAMAVCGIMPQANAQESIDNLEELKAQADKLTALYKAEDLVASSELMNRCTQAFLKLLPTAPPKEAGDWRKVHTQLMPIYEGLLIEGAELTEFPSWPDLVKLRKKGNAGKGKDKEAAEMTPAKPQVSFTKDIAPWMMDQCSRCHVGRREGGFSIATFEALMKGDAGGVVLSRGCHW